MLYFGLHICARFRFLIPRGGYLLDRTLLWCPDIPVCLSLQIADGILLKELGCCEYRDCVPGQPPC